MKLDWKEMVRYAKGRGFMYVWTNAWPFLLIDIVGWKFWQYACVFIVPNFFLNYYIYKRVFQKKHKMDKFDIERRIAISELDER